MKFEYLEVKNWKCFKQKQRWDFSNYELITKRNGTGKTSMFQAIIYLLYGKIPTGFNLNTVRNSDEDDCELLLRFSHNYSEYEIKKVFGSKKICELRIDNELVAESAGTVNEFVNNIVDKRIAIELWTQSLTDSGILAPSYINTVILEDMLSDPINLKNHYRYENRTLRKEINAFKGEIIDIDALKDELDSIKDLLQQKGSSREKLAEALKIQELYNQYKQYSEPIHSLEDVEEFLSIVKTTLEDTQSQIQKEIDKETEYLKFEEMELPNVTKEDHDKIKNITLGKDVNDVIIELEKKLEQASEFLKFKEMEKPSTEKEKTLEFLHVLGNSDLKGSKLSLAKKITEESKYLEFERLPEPTQTEEKMLEYKKALNSLTLEEAKEKLDKKIAEESAFKEFEKRSKPKFTQDEVKEFLKLANSNNFNNTDVKDQLVEKLDLLASEQEKTINRFLGISKEEILKCAQKSLETHECVFCKSNFDHSHESEIEIELDKPSRNENLISKLKEEIEILKRYGSVKEAKYELIYWDEEIIYNQKIQNQDYLNMLISQRELLNLYANNTMDYVADLHYYEMKKLYEEKTKDTSYLDELKHKLTILDLYDNIEQALSDKEYWDFEVKYLEGMKNISYLDELKEKISLITLYSNQDEFVYADSYWKAKDLYDVKSQDQTYLNELKHKLEVTNMYNDLSVAKNDKNYYTYKKLFDEAEVSMPDYVEVIKNHDSETVSLWEKHDELQQEYIEAVKQKEELDRINELKKTVESNSDKIEMIEDYIYQASNYYIQNIKNKTSEQLSQLNNRYKAVEYSEDGFFVIVEDEYQALNIIPVSQLSSGETTIFALSLLFAIHDVMTPDLPFMFDETFAQLDRENLAEVKKLLSSRNDQIFVITHDLSWSKEE